MLQEGCSERSWVFQIFVSSLSKPITQYSRLMSAYPSPLAFPVEEKKMKGVRSALRDLPATAEQMETGFTIWDFEKLLDVKD